jgi:hypothetical protein
MQKRFSKEAKVSALELLVLAVVIVLFWGTGRDHAGLTVFTLSGSDAAPWRDIIVAVIVAYIVLVRVVAPFELLGRRANCNSPGAFRQLRLPARAAVLWIFTHLLRRRLQTSVVA